MMGVSVLHRDEEGVFFASSFISDIKWIQKTSEEIYRGVVENLTVKEREPRIPMGWFSKETE